MRDLWLCVCVCAQERLHMLTHRMYKLKCKALMCARTRACLCVRHYNMIVLRCCSCNRQTWCAYTNPSVSRLSNASHFAQTHNKTSRVWQVLTCKIARFSRTHHLSTVRVHCSESIGRAQFTDCCRVYMHAGVGSPSPGRAGVQSQFKCSLSQLHVCLYV